MQKLRYSFVLITGLLFLFSACEYKFIEPKDPNIDPDQTISFSSDIIPIFEDKCVDCHSPSGTVVSLEAGDAYNNILGGGLVDTENPDQSIIYTKAEPNASHAALYSVDEAGTVLLWIQQGAENN